MKETIDKRGEGEKGKLERGGQPQLERGTG